MPTPLQREHFSAEHIDAINVDPENNYFTKVLQETLTLIPTPKKVCDVACGNGLFTSKLKDWTACTLVGVDGSQYALKQAERLNFDQLLRVNDFSVDLLPFNDEHFDLVISKDALEHMLDPEHLVSEMARITKKDGHALIHVPNHFPLIGRIKLLFNNTIDPFDYFPDSDRWNFPHIRFYTSQSLCDLFGKYHFKLTSNLSYNFFQFGRAGAIIPESMKKILSKNSPDAWTEGYTMLFRKS